MLWDSSYKWKVTLSIFAGDAPPRKKCPLDSFCLKRNQPVVWQSFYSVMCRKQILSQWIRLANLFSLKMSYRNFEKFIDTKRKANRMSTAEMNLPRAVIASWFVIGWVNFDWHCVMWLKPIFLCKAWLIVRSSLLPYGVIIISVLRRILDFSSLYTVNMLKLVRRYRHKSTDGHIKDKHGQELFVFNKVDLHSLQCSISVICHMCWVFSLPDYRTWISTQTKCFSTRSEASPTRHWNRRRYAENVSLNV